jgi:ABC-type multidrug transport system fused ATPase/permease subunit
MHLNDHETLEFDDRPAGGGGRRISAAMALGRDEPIDPNLLSLSTLGIDRVSSAVTTLIAGMTRIAEERQQVERLAHEARQQLNQSAAQEREQTLAHAASRVDPASLLPQRLAALAAQQQRLLSGVSEAAQRRRLRVRTECDNTCTELAAAPVDLADDPAHQRMLQRSAELRRRLDAFLLEVATLGKRHNALEVAFMTACRRARIGGGVGSAATPQISLPLRERLASATAQLKTAEESWLKIQHSSAYQDTGLGGQLLNHGLLLFAHLLAAGLAWLVFPQALLGIAVLGAALQFLVPLRTRGQRRRLAAHLAKIRPQLANLGGMLQQLERAGRTELDPQGPMQPRVERLLNAEQERVAEQERLRAACETAIATIRRREQTVRERIEARRESAETAFRRTTEAAIASHRAEIEKRLASLECATAASRAADDHAWLTRRGECASQWLAAVDAAQAYASACRQEMAARHHPWDDPLWLPWRPPMTFASELPLGQMQLTLSALAAKAGAADKAPTISVPVALAFPYPAALLVRVNPSTRAAGLSLIQQLLQRALVAFPAGKMRLRLIDPQGLGESFSPLLDLAEHDESLLGDGVLNETVAIERGLEDLVAHLETVIQKRLRGRYATLQDYNREAGELQEPLRLVAVADFPAGFSERARERLNLLIRTGARCGVHVLLMQDERRPLPADFDLAWFGRAGLILRSQHGRLQLEREDLQEWSFTPEPTVPPSLQQQLLTIVGNAADGAQRIELGFSTVAPGETEIWSKSSAKGVAIPLGKRGPERLQMLELGRGTAQHVLIGGRTGSGKSTLLHVLITSASLWYAPSEIEFHLIDFKKGVEFKGYATNRLPHARVVAIESDREFGLSVLRQLDRELTSRGEAFRAVGAQDLAAHRAAGRTHLPRILLIIDEFQEFFTEDDAIARDAALLLDRFVRQGRAFGVHVILGSQTLAGSYSLAKSSLGQMGVRIALPCNEADAHLLLNEDNDAARLLTRPGDAVYNDQAGMTAGNSPFQVCWLSDEQEAGYVKPLAVRASTSNWRPLQPPVFFEGSAPSDLSEMPPSSNPQALWVGQSSSLSGAAMVPFAPSAGGNLLIIGQNREAAAATCGALLVSLAGDPSARLLALDGEDAEGPFAGLTSALAPLVPRFAAKDAGTVLGELNTVLERRQNGDDAQRSPIFLVVFALQRQRALRVDEDGDFAGGSGRKPAEILATLLANGAEYGIHLVVWCDSLSSLQRSLGRRAVRDFDARILFQMAATDSAELIDEDSASRLGLHTALLAIESDGRREKFRPCSLPSAATLRDLASDRRKF